MKQVLRATAAIIAVVMIALFSIWYWMELWNECRQTNSIMYCWKVVGK